MTKTEQNRVKRLLSEQRVAHQFEIANKLNTALADPTNDLLQAVEKLRFVIQSNSVPAYIKSEVAEAIALIRPHCIDPKESTNESSSIERQYRANRDAGQRSSLVQPPPTASHGWRHTIQFNGARDRKAQTLSLTGPSPIHSA